MSLPAAYLRCTDARDGLEHIPRRTVPLVCSSPAFLGLIDYKRASEKIAEGGSIRRTRLDNGVWRPAGPQHELALLPSYIAEHSAIIERLLPALAPDAVVALEVDAVRLRTSGDNLVLLPDLWAQMLQGYGLRIFERITLTRTLALGRRSGHFLRYGNRPGYALPDNVTSTLLIAVQGDPLKRLRREATAADAVDAAWAQRFLRNNWTLKPPRRTNAQRAAGHPVPMDREVIQAIIRFYSRRGQIVLDPFAGGGTVGSVALGEGRTPILLEREQGFAALAATALHAAGAAVRDLTDLPRHSAAVQFASAALSIPLGGVIETVARRAFLQGSTAGDVTQRHRDIARKMASEFGLEVSPELAALFLRAERSHYAA